MYIGAVLILPLIFQSNDVCLCVYPQKCQKCLILNEDCDSLGALRLLREEVNTMRKDKPNPRTVDTELFGLFDMHMDHHSNTEAPLDDLCRRPDCRNPKLMELEDLLLKAVKKDDDDDG